MFIIYVIYFYQPKIKCKGRGSYFYKDKKYRWLEKEKKLGVISFQKFLIFPIWAFPENAQNFVRAFL